MLAVHQHDLRRARCSRARTPPARDPTAAAPPCAGERDERDTPAPAIAAVAGRERGDVVGVDDPLGQAQHGRLHHEPAAEHEHDRQPRVDGGPSLALEQVEPATSSAAPSSPNRANGSSQPAWSPRPTPNRRSGPGAAEGDRVPFAALGALGRGGGRGLERGSGWPHGRRGAGVRGAGGGVDAALARGGDVRAWLDDRAVGAAGLAFDAPEAVVFERQPELGVVGRAAHVGALGGGCGFHEGDPRERHGDHHQAGRQQLGEATRRRPRRADEVGERDPGDDEIGGERLGVEGEPDGDAAADQRAPAPVSQARSPKPQARSISRISTGSTPLSRETATNEGNTASASAPAIAAATPRRRASST